MPRYDLAGNPMPDDDQQGNSHGQPGNPGAPSYGGQPPRYDLSGNPMPQAPQYPGQQPPPGMGQRPPAYTPPGASNYPPPGGYPQGQPAPGPYGGQGYAQPVPVVSNDSSKPGTVFWIIGGLVVGAVVAFLIINAPHPLPATATFTHYVDPYKQFNCDQPDGWDTVSAEQINQQDADPSVDVGGVIFKKFGAKIDITTGTVASLAASMLMAPGDGSQALAGSKLPELDTKNYNKTKNSFSQYNEVSSGAISTSFGESKAYEFTAAGPKFGLPVATHGYLVEMVGGTHSCVLIATAPESDWANAKPVFNRVISTIAEGANAPSAGDQSQGYSGAPQGGYGGGGGQPTGNLSAPSSIAAPATNAAGSYGMGQ